MVHNHVIDMSRGSIRNHPGENSATCSPAQYDCNIYVEVYIIIHSERVAGSP